MPCRSKRHCRRGVLKFGGSRFEFGGFGGFFGGLPCLKRKGVFFSFQKIRAEPVGVQSLKCRGE